MPIVLEATGKRDELETICIKEFGSNTEADNYCDEVFKGGKYWKNAFIVTPDHEYDTEDLAEDRHGNHLWGID